MALPNYPSLIIYSKSLPATLLLLFQQQYIMQSGSTDLVLRQQITFIALLLAVYIYLVFYYLVSFFNPFIESYANLLGSQNQISRKQQSGIQLRLQPAVIKYTTGPTVGQLATIEIIKDLYKDDLNDFIADLSNNAKKRFLTSLSDNETNAVINLGYLLVSQTMPFSPPSLS